MESLPQTPATINDVAWCMGVLREHLPRSVEETVPELAEVAELVHEHLRALTRAAAGGEAVTPGALAVAVNGVTSRLADDPVAMEQRAAMNPWRRRGRRAND